MSISVRFEFCHLVSGSNLSFSVLFEFCNLVSGSNFVSLCPVRIVSFSVRF